MQTVNFTKPATSDMMGLPPEMQIEALQLARKRALADALVQQSMQQENPNQVVAGHVVRYSPLQGIAKLGQAYFGRKAQENADNAQKDLAAKYNTQLAEAVRNYTTKTTGGPETLGEDVAGPTRPFVPASDADKRAAIISGMTSGFSPLANIASQDWKDLMKNQLTIKDIGAFMKDFTPESVQAFVASGGKTPLQRNINARSDGGVTYDTTTGKPIGATSTYGPVGPVPGTDGVVGQKNEATGRYNFAPRGVNVSQSVNNHAGNKEIDAMVGSHQDTKKVAMDAVADVNILKQATEALNLGVKAGSLADWRNAIDKFAVTAGFKNDDGSVANTDTFMRQMAGRMLAHAKELRPMSDSDVKILTEMSAGKNMTVDGLKKLIEIGMDNALGKIEAHNKAVEMYQETRPGYKQQMYVQMPNFPQLPPGTSDNPNATGLSIGPRKPTSQANSRPQRGGVDPDEEARKLGGRRIQ